MLNVSRRSLLQRVALLFALAVLTGFWLTPQTFAQRFGGSPEERQARMAAQTDTLVQQLGLHGEQEAAVRAILGEQNTRRMELMTAARESGSFTSVRDEMAALRAETDAKLAEVLTGAQMATYKKIQEERRNRRGGRRGGM